MSSKKPTNIPASVNARLKQLARERGDDAQLLLTRYANERLLYRLSLSPHATNFVLKGAALFIVWTGQPHRVTRDVDLLGFGEISKARLLEVFTEVLTVAVPDDGVTFDLASMVVTTIREEQSYGGIRVVLQARIASARVRIQIDIGFGDTITPHPIAVDFPTLLDFPAPHLRAYPRETVVAEKLEAMVQLSINNSRMKDFFDIALLSKRFDFDGKPLVDALRATFKRRGTPLPPTMPVALTPAFAEDSLKLEQWSGFARKAGVENIGSLADAVAAVAHFASEPLRAAAHGESFDRRWLAGGPWTIAAAY
jgi:predicted nucleotidyltransferase component of viral defense system